jgi:hypothetical protein
MKQLFYTLCFSLLIVSANAQGDPGRPPRPNDQRDQRPPRDQKMGEGKRGRGQMSPEKKANLEMFKIQFVTKKLNLTPAEAQSFWPVYNEHKNAIQAILKEKKDNEIDMEEALLTARKKMAIALKPILKSDERVNEALKVDREFLRRVRFEMFRRKGMSQRPS